MKSRIIVCGIAIIGLGLGACSTESVDNLEPGDCFNISSEATTISNVPIVDCAKPHDQEVFYVFEIDTLAEFDQSGIDEVAIDKCVTAFEGYVGVDFYDEQVANLDLSFATPSEDGWDDGDRGVVCTIMSIDPSVKVTGSQKGAFS